MCARCWEAWNREMRSSSTVSTCSESRGATPSRTRWLGSNCRPGAMDNSENRRKSFPPFSDREISLEYWPTDRYGWHVPPPMGWIGGIFQEKGKRDLPDPIQGSG